MQRFNVFDKVHLGERFGTKLSDLIAPIKKNRCWGGVRFEMIWSYNNKWQDECLFCHHNMIYSEDFPDFRKWLSPVVTRNHRRFRRFHTERGDTTTIHTFCCFLRKPIFCRCLGYPNFEKHKKTLWTIGIYLRFVCWDMIERCFAIHPLTYFQLTIPGRIWLPLLQNWLPKSVESQLSCGWLRTLAPG